MMVCLKCALYISMLITIEATHTPSTTLDIPPEVKADDEQPFETEPDPSMLRGGFDHYDMYDYTSVPIPDVFKSIFLEHQHPKKIRLTEDALEYEDSDLLFDSPILDNPYSLLDNPLLDPLGSSLLDSGTIIKGPLIKASSVIKRRPMIKRPILSSILAGRQAPMWQSPFKKRQSMRGLERLLKMLLPLFRNAGLGMRARFQFAREGPELRK